MSFFNRPEIVEDFQLLDDEFEATRGGVLPETLRQQMRRNKGEIVQARTRAYRKALPALIAQNDFDAEYLKALKMRKEIEELEGERSEVAELRRENERLRKTVDAREAEIERTKNRAIAERAQSAAAVSSVGGVH